MGNMRAIIQRVERASVTLRETGEKRAIGRGFAVLLGITNGDTESDAAYLADRILGIRILGDDAGKMNLSLTDVPGAELLVISQFTLYGDATTGRRPSFTAAARPDVAVPLYEHFVRLLRQSPIPTKTGEFGADMLVEIHNDGPVTMILDSTAKKS